MERFFCTKPIAELGENKVFFIIVAALTREPRLPESKETPLLLALGLCAFLSDSNGASRYGLISSMMRTTEEFPLRRNGLFFSFGCLTDFILAAAEILGTKTASRLYS